MVNSELINSLKIDSCIFCKRDIQKYWNSSAKVITYEKIKMHETGYGMKMYGDSPIYSTKISCVCLCGTTYIIGMQEPISLIINLPMREAPDFASSHVLTSVLYFNGLFVSRMGLRSKWKKRNNIVFNECNKSLKEALTDVRGFFSEETKKVDNLLIFG